MPLTQIMTQDNNIEYAPVGLARRMGAVFYDLLIVVAALFIATIFWTAAGVTFGHPWYRAYVAFVYLSAFVYFGWCWVRGGQTVGMKVWKIKLVSTDARRFGWPAAMARSAAALLSAVTLGAGFWWVLFDRDGLAWHDRLSSSRLIHSQEPDQR